MQQQPLVFISYARKNASLVDTLEHRIQARGFNTWVDRQGLSGGQQWANAIQQAIVQCDVFLLVLTPDALASDFVWQEVRFAKSLGKRAIVVYSRSVGQFPAELQGLPVVDFRKRREQGFFHIFDAIDRLGARIVVPPGGFDGELALTLAYVRRAPSDWQVAFATQGYYAVLTGICIIFAAIFVLAAFLNLTNNRLLTSVLHDFFLLLQPFGSFSTYAIAIFTVLLALQYVQLARGSTPPEMLAITPQGVAWRQFLPWRRNTFRTRQLTYGEIVALTVRQLPILGTWLHFDTTRAVDRHLNLALSWRFGSSQALAERITAAHQRYKSMAVAQLSQAQPVASGQTAYAQPAYLPAAPAMVAPAQAMPGPQPRMASAPVPVQPWIFICGSSRDRGFVRRLQRRLAYRQLTFYDGAQYAGAPAQAQQVLDTCPVVMVIVSPVSLKSDPVRRQYLYALNQRKTVIPIITKSGMALPGELQSLQWLDFGQPQAWERRILDFILALAASGIPSPPGVFDGDLAIVRTMHGQLPPGWNGYRVEPGYYVARYRRVLLQAIYYSIAGVFVTLLAALFVVLAFALDQLLGDGFRNVVLAIGLLIFASAWIRPTMYIAQTRAFSQLKRELAVPDLVVVTPEGWATHYRSGRFARVKIGYYQFDAYADMMAQRFFNSFIIHMRGKDNRYTKMHIPGIFDDPTAIAESVITAFQAVRHRSRAL